MSDDQPPEVREYIPGYLYDDVLDTEKDALARLDVFDELPPASLEVIAMVMAYETQMLKEDAATRVLPLDSQANIKLAAVHGMIAFAERLGRRASKRLIELQGLDIRPPVINDEESSDHNEPD